MALRNPWHISVSAWPIIAITGATSIIWMRAAGLKFEWQSALLSVIACLGLVTLGYFYRTKRPDRGIAATLDGLAQIIAYGVCATPLSYAVASTGGPLWDSTFFAWDQWFGLDWVSYLHFVNGHPWLGWAFTLAYRSLMLQIILIVIVLGFSDRVRELKEFVLAFVMAGTGTVLVSAFMPAMANFVYLQLSPASFPNLNPAAAYVHVADLVGLRDGTLRSVSLNGIEGIITFPSFHATLGVLFLWAFWSVRLLRIPALVLNALLIAATPIDGGHYFVDVLAGAIAAILAIYVAHRSIVGRSKSGASDLSFEAAVCRQEPRLLDQLSSL